MYTDQKEPFALSPQSILDELFDGFNAFFSGVPLLLRNRALIGLSLIPVLGSLMLILLLMVGSVWLVNALMPTAPPGMQMIANALVVLIVLLLGLAFYMPIARILLAPFSEALSRKTIEVAGLGWLQLERPSAVRAFIEGAKLVACQVLVIAVGGVVSFALPVIGHIAWIVLLVVLCATDYLDVPFSARGLSFKDKLALLWKYKIRVLGFGVAAYVMLLIPVANLASLPIGVIGATLLTSRMRQ